MNIPSLVFCTHPAFAEHQTSRHHPERPDRIRAVNRAVRQAGLITSPDLYPEFEIDLAIKSIAGIHPLAELPPPGPADLDVIRLVHPASHVDRLLAVCRAGGGVLDQGDTPVCAGSFDIARLAVGAIVQCCDEVAAGRHRRAFAAVRPPGHHAEPNRAMGFCMFSNIAIGARYLQKRHGVGKIAIVDFDVHHGNGTQACFIDDPSVLFISLHQDPRTLYPGSGHDWETGTGAGLGYTLNLLMNPGSDDDDYLSAMRERVVPALDAFRPEMLLISAGFDAHFDDPLAQIALSESGFEQITRILSDAANQHCGGKIVSTLEGGYHLRALGRSVVRHLVGLS